MNKRRRFKAKRRMNLKKLFRSILTGNHPYWTPPIPPRNTDAEAQLKRTMRTLYNQCIQP